jgi:hypothetical protein
MTVPRHRVKRNPQAYSVPVRWLFQPFAVIWLISVTCFLFERIVSLDLTGTLCALGFGLFGNLMFWLIVWQPVLHWKLAKSGETAIGRITKRIHRPYIRGPNHMVAYIFVTPDGLPRRGRTAVKEEVWEAAKCGDEFPVWYLRSLPGFNVAGPFCEFQRVSDERR